jgi:hypothetical protein
MAKKSRPLSLRYQNPQIKRLSKSRRHENESIGVLFARIGCSVSFRIVTLGGGPGGVSGGADTKRRCKIFDDLFFTNFLLFPAKPATTPPFLRPFVYIFSSFRSHKRKHNLILLLSNRRAISSIGSRASPQKKFFVKFPRGAQRFARGGGGSGPPGECLNETLIGCCTDTEVLPQYQTILTTPRFFFLGVRRQ